MNRTKFEEHVQQAIDELPDVFLEKLDNVEIVVEDRPSLQLLESLGLSSNGILLGLYQGIPTTRRSSNYSLVLPDKITIFQASIESLYKTEQAVIKGIKDTIIHEIAHHFGMSEDQLR